MNGETTRDLLLILVMAVVTFATRLLPFLLLTGGRSPQGGALSGAGAAPAIMAMLIAHRLKGRQLCHPGGVGTCPLSCGAVVLLHLWKGNDLLSIFGGTILYMALVQGVFG